MKTDIAQMVRNLREHIGFSQQQLADKLKLNRATVSDLENGKRELTLEEAIKLYLICQGDLIEKRTFFLDQVEILNEMIKKEKDLPSLSKKEMEYYQKLK